MNTIKFFLKWKDPDKIPPPQTVFEKRGINMTFGGGGEAALIM